jgi:hypothetical protein
VAKQGLRRDARPPITEKNTIAPSERSQERT